MKDKKRAWLSVGLWLATAFIFGVGAMALTLVVGTWTIDTYQEYHYARPELPCSQCVCMPVPKDKVKPQREKIPIEYGHTKEEVSEAGMSTVNKDNL